MKGLSKKILLGIFCIFCCISLVEATNLDGTFGEGSSVGDNKSDTNTKGGLYFYRDIGLRVTVYDQDGKKVSNSVDVVFAEEVYQDFIRHGNTFNTLSSEYKSKIDYKKGEKVVWEKSSLKDKIIIETNNSTQRADISPDDNKLPESVLYDNVVAWFKNIDSKNKNGFPVKVDNALNICGGKCEDNKNYYAVFEPTLYIKSASENYYGTSYELAYKFMDKDNSTSVKDEVKNLDGWINNNLPRLLMITGITANKTFYKNVGLEKYCDTGNTSTCFGEGNKNKIKRSNILNSGVGIAVYDWTDKIRKDLLKDKICTVNVNINECGESNIYEAIYNSSINNKECIVDNDAYAYIKECNLYCSDEISTNFSGLYNTFVGNNSLGAIVSGKYISIEKNPTITIKKTCYQSSKSNECSNVTSSLANKLKSDYQTNKMYLTVDGRKYDLIGNASISQSGLTATITYEYKLNNATNKYISIETSNAVAATSSMTYVNQGPKIITNIASFGKYQYNLDVSETVLNKYSSNSAAIKKLVNTKSNNYKFINTITINYKGENGSKKDNYNKNNLEAITCSYMKYNSVDGCICAKNKCCDSVTCEEVPCPPPTDGDKQCTCKSECGCYDDGKCTPILSCDPEPSHSNPCNPEKQICFPNLIYRPISLTNPFPGIEGNGRTPGSNWNKIYKTSDGKGISYSEYYVTSRRGYDGYEIYQAEPLYVIKLDGEKIQAIRKYNEKHNNNYNDVELSCKNGEKCISQFLRGKEKDFNINLIESGTCKNINSNSFDSCIKDKGK